MSMRLFTPAKPVDRREMLEDAYCLIEQAGGMAALLAFHLESIVADKATICTVYALESILDGIQTRLLAAIEAPKESG